MSKSLLCLALAALAAGAFYAPAASAGADVYRPPYADPAKAAANQATAKIDDGVVRVGFYFAPGVAEMDGFENLDAYIAAAVEEMQGYYDASGVSAEFQRAFLRRLPAWLEHVMAEGDQQEFLQSLRLTTNAYWSASEQELRESDVIVVVREEADDVDWCGVATQNNESDLLSDITFSNVIGLVRPAVLASTCPSAGYVLAHEVGHLLGAAHSVSDLAEKPYGHGWQSQSYFDIMDYTGMTVGKAPAFIFADPDVSLNDEVMGDASTSDLQRLFNEHMPHLSAKAVAVVAPSTVWIEADNDVVSEADGEYVFRIHRKGDLAGNASVSWSVVTANGTALYNDFVQTYGDVEFLPGQSTREVTFVIAGDQEDEGDETFKLVLSSPINTAVVDADDSPASLLVTIAGPAKVAAAEQAISVAEGGVARITLMRTGDPRKAVTINWRVVAGTAITQDIVRDGGMVMIPAGATSTELAIEVVDDNQVEGVESFTVVFEEAVGASLDGAAPVLVSIAASDAAPDDGSSGGGPVSVAGVLLLWLASWRRSRLT